MKNEIYDNMLSAYDIGIRYGYGATEAERHI